MWGGWAVSSTENKDRTEQDYENNHFQETRTQSKPKKIEKY